MATPMDSGRIRREITRKYESDPKNWRLQWGIDERGHYNLFVEKDFTLWWLKEELINPLLSVGCGIRTLLEEDLERKVFSENRSDPSFGLRPVREEQFNRIINDLERGRTPQIPIKQILYSEPKPLRELGTPFFIEGPVYRMPQLTDVLSDKQKELNSKLNTELERSVLRRYPQLKMSYT